MAWSIAIITVILISLIVWGVELYNRIIRLKNIRESAWSNIDIQLRQRHDLIPNLVATVKAYVHHEHITLVEVTEARGAAIRATTIDDRIEAENRLTNALINMRYVMERYPDIKANVNFMHLQSELVDIENKIVAVRRYFNSTTREYNISRKREYLADAAAVEITSDSLALASALGKIANRPKLSTDGYIDISQILICNIQRKSKGIIGWFHHLFDTHPLIEERIALPRQF